MNIYLPICRCHYLHTALTYGSALTSGVLTVLRSVGLMTWPHHHHQHGAFPRANHSQQISYHLCLIKANGVQAMALGTSNKVCLNCFLNACHLLPQPASTYINVNRPKVEPVHTDTKRSYFEYKIDLRVNKIGELFTNK